METGSKVRKQIERMGAPQVRGTGDTLEREEASRPRASSSTQSLDLLIPRIRPSLPLPNEPQSTHTFLTHARLRVDGESFPGPQQPPISLPLMTSPMARSRTCCSRESMCRGEENGARSGSQGSRSEVVKAQAVLFGRAGGEENFHLTAE